MALTFSGSVKTLSDEITNLKKITLSIQNAHFFEFV